MTVLDGTVAALGLAMMTVVTLTAKAERMVICWKSIETVRSCKRGADDGETAGKTGDFC